MRCSDCRHLLMEADPAELRGIGHSDLAAHLRTCETCRRAARQLLDGEQLLRAALLDLRPHGSAAVAAQAAIRASGRRRRRLFVVVPLMTAAGIAALLLLLLRPGEFTPGTPRPLAGPPPIVEAPSGQDVIVYQTANPDVVVVWLYQRKGG
jgi:anti-sigma factor RsiW